MMCAASFSRQNYPISRPARFEKLETLETRRRHLMGTHPQSKYLPHLPISRDLWRLSQYPTLSRQSESARDNANRGETALAATQPPPVTPASSPFSSRVLWESRASVDVLTLFSSYDRRNRYIIKEIRTVLPLVRWEFALLFDGTSHLFLNRD